VQGSEFKTPTPTKKEEEQKYLQIILCKRVNIHIHKELKKTQQQNNTKNKKPPTNYSMKKWTNGLTFLRRQQTNGQQACEWLISIA
jgi:hypothetical protein